MPSSPLSPRVLILGALICAVATAVTPYATLKLGMSVDMAYAGMFAGAALLARQARERKELAVQLNLLQVMINVCSGVGFMVVILAAFHYIQAMTGRSELALGLAWWQVAIWLFLSASLGVFMGALPRRLVLDDPSLPWPTGRAVVSVAETLSDPSVGETTQRRRKVLGVSTAVSALVGFLRDGLGVISSMTGNPLVKMTMSLDLIGIGFGMLVPLGVGLSGLVGVWLIGAYGERVAQLAALNGTSPEHWEACRQALTDGVTSDFVKASCGRAADYIASAGAGRSVFEFVVLWMMWPATAMMIAAAVTGAAVPVVRNALQPKEARRAPTSLADEEVPLSWILGAVGAGTVALVVVQSTWLDVPWYDVLLSVAIQPVLIVAGMRVLAITGSGPVSLFANAMQFLFGLFRPGELRTNLVMAHLAADSQASSEATGAAFWAARRLGGSFKSLLIAQMLVLPVAAVLTPVCFDLMARTYGIGFEEGQLSAPTGLKIASLALVMEKGTAGLPKGALEASLVAVGIGIVLELLLAMRRKDADGQHVQRFPWLPIPSAVGFALILPPALSLAIAVGSVISAVWRTFSPKEEGSWGLYGAPLASGMLAGESVVGGLLLPFLAWVVGAFG